MDQPPLPPGKDRADDRLLLRGFAVLLVVVVGLLAYRVRTEMFGTRPLEVVRPSHRIDVNTARRSDLLQLPGVGPGRADRIIAHRSQFGPLQSDDDLLDIEGVGPATMQRLQPHLIIDGATDPVRLQRKPIEAGTSKGPLNLNAATLDELDALPGIGRTIAQRIIAEREHRPFKSVADLDRVPGIGAKRMEALRPLVTVEK